MKDLTKGILSTPDTGICIADFSGESVAAYLQSCGYKNRWLFSWRGYTCSSGSYHDTEQSDDWISDGIVQWICNYYRAEIWSER